MASRFLEDQQRFFADADVAHFEWQTGNPYFARTERALLRGLPLGEGQAVLEVGCGEGGNVVNLGAAAARARLLVGVDLFEAKVRFAGSRARPGRFLCADALALPFRAGSFDLVLCRDLLHHLERPERAVAELRRVCRAGGTAWVVEPNGRNPLIRLLAHLRPHERGLLRSSPGALLGLVRPHFREVELEMRQPLPLFRMVLHYQWGLPALGRSRLVGALLDAADRVLQAAWPRPLWAYVVAKLRA